MKDLSYTRIFPQRKLISHEESMKEKLRSKISQIIMDEFGVSEKSFKEVDKILKLVEKNITPELMKLALEEYKSGKRISYVSEILYHDHFKKLCDGLNESKISKFNEYNRI
jgi:hypothetical protein